MDQQPSQQRRNAGGDLITALVDEVFQLNGRLQRAGDALTAAAGLTSSRWQVLGALGDGPATAAQIARRRGLRRQSAQEIVTRLNAEGLVDIQPNPQDRRAPLVSLTDRARMVLAEVGPSQVRWANELGAAFSTAQLADTLNVLSAIRTAIEAQLPA